MRQRVIKMLRPFDAQSVESPCQPGIPDVNCTRGWIELKWLREWPKNIETPVRLDHYTPQQRVWAVKRRLAGGNVWLLLQCRQEWLLFDGVIAAEKLGHVPYPELISAALMNWTTGIDPAELQHWISRTLKDYLSTDADAAKIRSMLRSGLT